MKRKNISKIKIVNLIQKYIIFFIIATMAKVLILEQSDSMRNCLRERLEYEGYTTEGVDCAERAVQMCEKIPFDVILSDDAKGLTATKVPLIVLSANNTVESAVDALHHGAVDFLTKPINMNRLLEAVRRNVRSHNVAPAPSRRDLFANRVRTVAATSR